MNTIVTIIYSSKIGKHMYHPPKYTKCEPILPTMQPVYITTASKS
jgi:hypothetical protein